MSRILLHHHEHFDLVADKDVTPDHGEPEGRRVVQGADGEEERGRYRINAQDNVTIVELPEDYDVNDMQAHVDLVKTLVDRHSDKVHAVEGDHASAPKLAALLGAEHRTVSQEA